MLEGTVGVVEARKICEHVDSSKNGRIEFSEYLTVAQICFESGIDSLIENAFK